MSVAEVSEISEAVDEDILGMGLSPMHGWIKSLEFLLHAATTRCIGYRYNAKKDDEDSGECNEVGDPEETAPGTWYYCQLP